MQMLVEAQTMIAKLATQIREYHHDTGGSNCDHSSPDFQSCICGELNLLTEADKLWQDIESAKGVLYGTTKIDTGS